MNPWQIRFQSIFLAAFPLLFLVPGRARDAECPSKAAAPLQSQALMQMHSHPEKLQNLSSRKTLPKKHKNVTAPPPLTEQHHLSLGHLFGSPKCPCIGLNNLTGETMVVVNGNTKARYPASVGAHCKAWDDGHEPLSCKMGGKPGEGNGWCAKQWCFVDPCNCDLDVKPKASSYLPDGMFQGKAIYYSYATCGANDTWNDQQEVKMQPADKSMCKRHIHSSMDWGKEECKCVGINGEPGTTHFTVSGEQVAFPADAGTMCRAWDLDSNPACTANRTDIPAWCAKRWCWVDPCSCSLAVPPKTSSYLPYASYEAKTMYYSYDTCGDDDLWTAKHHEHACVNKKSRKACTSHKKCSWDAHKSLCLGKEIVDECKHPKFENASEGLDDDKEHEVQDGKHKFGDARCPCVGLDNISGHTLVIVNGTRRTQYPADLGAHCEAWDDGREPLSCEEGQKPGKGNGWCAQQWCFVDPCNCNIDVKPKTSSYVPSGRYQGKPIYYSYATCGGKDTWNSGQKHKMKAAEQSMCKQYDHDSRDWGKDECKCIGVHGEVGTTLVTVGGREVKFPADTGTMCRAWDLDSNPSCIGDGTGNRSEIPKWCAKKWCYVDPCSCSLATPPKTSSYMPHSSFEGRAIFYSYDTCGDKDLWTAGNHKKACVNQKSQKTCDEHEKCGWDASKKLCLGKELVEECKHPKFLNDLDAHKDSKKHISTKAELKFGAPSCPCVAIDNITGNTVVMVNSTTKAYYPADLGAHCSAWDDDREPLSCKEGQKPGKKHGWCAQKWCFVDPCNCNIDVSPKTSSYLPDGLYQGKPIYYSYATCGGKDTWNEVQQVKMKAADKSLCKKHIQDSNNWGKDECKCIGIHGETGSTTFKLDGKNLTFPADAGTSCKAWDLESNPSCSAHTSEIPMWCAQKWCYVDPCSCSLAEVPKVSSYLRDASHDGRTIYYSYDTCGSVDHWTAKHSKNACVNQNSSAACMQQDKCGWDVEKNLCLGKELVDDCKHPKHLYDKSPVRPKKKHGWWGWFSHMWQPMHNRSSAHGHETSEYSHQAAPEAAKKKSHKLAHNHKVPLAAKYGSPECPCIGIDNLNGSSSMLILQRLRVNYPADVGSHCAPWDNGHQPLSCMEDKEPGKGQGWCAQPWCFVDPCNCDIKVKPSISSYLPDGSYQGRPVYYSHATCGGHGDSVTSAVNRHEGPKTASANRPSLVPREIKESHDGNDRELAMCKDSPAESLHGRTGCRCVGLGGALGSVNFTVAGHHVAYPADAGSSCRAWDLSNHPDCHRHGDGEVPEWCEQQWCYVDPCSCTVDVPPRASSYLPGAVWQGRPLYYSYDTCGSKDTWTTKHHKHACVIQKSAEDCSKLEKCTWDNNTALCQGRGLAKTCGAPKLKSFAPRARASFWLILASLSTLVLAWCMF